MKEYATMRIKRSLPFSVLVSCISTTMLTATSLANTYPTNSLAHSYLSFPLFQTEELMLSEYWVSEKLDGIRALWTGKVLLTRKGTKIEAPEWFTKGLPTFSVEGELWAGRKNFNVVQKTVLDKVPDNKAWSEIRFMLFDLPNHPEGFKQRYLKLTQVVDEALSEYVGLVEQKTLSSYDELYALIKSTEESGAEGLMLKRVSGNNHVISKPIKIKKHSDGEGRLIDFTEGKGKYQGMVGALVLQLDDGKILSVGSGLSDQMRARPPALGEMVTFRYNGYTSTGLPKFARFLRVRVPE